MTYEEITNLALRRALFFPASEIYQDAPSGFFDFGPYGTTIRRKIIEQWRKHFVCALNCLEMDGATTMPANVFKASGHLDNFNDPMTQCTKCNVIHRADKLLEEAGLNFKEATPVEQLTIALQQNKITCPKCKGQLGIVRQFNLMVKTDVGVGGKTVCYLRPESCQSIFTAWDRLKNTMRIKLPCGISQVGKVYRNEISPRQTLIRQVEFMQMETEIFFDPAQIDNAENWTEIENYHINVLRQKTKTIDSLSAKNLASKKIVSGKIVAQAMAYTQQLYVRLGIPLEKLRFREVGDDERAFYAKEGWDLEVQTSLGWIELGPINYRTDYDIKRHMEISEKDLRYTNEDGTKLIPHILEISLGVDRAVYAVLELAFRKKDNRTWLSLAPHIAPLHAGVLPLLKNKPEIVAKAKEIYTELKNCYELFYDETGSIGKRYARLDEIGVPFCITIDFDSLTNNDVTLRDRDSGEQKRVAVTKLRDTLYKLITTVPFREV